MESPERTFCGLIRRVRVILRRTWRTADERPRTVGTTFAKRAALGGREQSARFPVWGGLRRSLEKWERRLCESYACAEPPQDNWQRWRPPSEHCDTSRRNPDQRELRNPPVSEPCTSCAASQVPSHWVLHTGRTLPLYRATASVSSHLVPVLAPR